MLQVSGNYVGSVGSRIVLNTVVAGDNAPSDRLVINGGSATGTSAIQVNNAGGPGAETVANGIPVVQAINGGSTATGAFQLANLVVAGPFEYLLFRGSVDASAPNDWFLRNDFVVPPTPVPPTPTPPTSTPTPPTAPTPTPPISGGANSAGEPVPAGAAAGAAAARRLPDRRAAAGGLWRGATHRATAGPHPTRHAARADRRHADAGQCRPRRRGLGTLGLGALLRTADRQPLPSLRRSARQRPDPRDAGRDRSVARRASSPGIAMSAASISPMAIPTSMSTAWSPTRRRPAMCCSTPVR